MDSEILSQNAPIVNINGKTMQYNDRKTLESLLKKAFKGMQIDPMRKKIHIRSIDVA